MLMLVLYSSSSGQGKVEMVDAYVGAVEFLWWKGKFGMEDAYVGAV